MDAVPPEPEPDVDSVDGGRMRRAIGLMAISCLVIAAVAAVYVHPALGGPARPAPVRLPSASSYSLAAVDFVSPTTGWIAAIFDDGDFVLMRTTDAGDTWKPELSGPTGGHGVYMKFFDAVDGMFALTGARPLLYRTADGGTVWTAGAALTANATVLSWSFADPANGWMLVHVDPRTAFDVHLYRTADAGQAWTDLGRPVSPPDQAFSVAFGAGGAGWLTTLSSGPYAYRSGDYGASWKRVELPSAGGPAARGQFLVAAQPVGATGVVASLVGFTPPQGRSGIGDSILDYPPLKVRAFDGGAAVTYVYAVAGDTLAPQRLGAGQSDALTVEAPDQVQLSSVDGGWSWRRISLPSAPGAIGVLDAWHWWWIGPGRESRTADAGATWSSPRSVAVPLPLAGSLQVLDPTHAWYAAVEGVRPVLIATDDAGGSWRTVRLPPMSGRFTP